MAAVWRKRVILKNYLHQKIGYEIRSISGSLTVFDELRLDFQDRQLLCIVHVGVIDNACCGSGGCILIEVPGYLISPERQTDADGCMISKVRPVEEEEEKKEIAAIIDKLYPNAQIRFS
jgi:hypothetical protein